MKIMRKKYNKKTGTTQVHVSREEWKQLSALPRLHNLRGFGAFEAAIREVAHQEGLPNAYIKVPLTAHILSYSWMCSYCDRENPHYQPQCEDSRPVERLMCQDCGRVYAVGRVEYEDE